MPKTLLLRAHQVKGIKLVHTMQRQDFIDTQTQEGYTPEFLAWSYDKIRQLFQNPNQMFLIVADKLDFICRTCIDMQGNPNCSFARKQRGQPVRQYVGAAFGTQDSEDVEVARKYDVQLNLRYSASQLRQKRNF